MSDDIPIGPGTPCWECGKDYGQHKATCSIGKEKAKTRADKEAEDAISKVDLLKRLERLEVVAKLKRGWPRT